MHDKICCPIFLHVPPSIRTVIFTQHLKYKTKTFSQKWQKYTEITVNQQVSLQDSFKTFPQKHTCTYSISWGCCYCCDMICDNRMEVPRQDFGRTYPTRPLTQQSDQQDCTMIENCEDQQWQQHWRMRKTIFLQVALGLTLLYLAKKLGRRLKSFS